jgi:hypothetical protein
MDPSEDIRALQDQVLTPEDWKMAIVERQTCTFFLINTALYLWFKEQDPISEHLLAASALDVLKGVGHRKNVTSHVFNSEMEKLLGKKLRMAMNFFKHGPDSHGKPSDIDPDAALQFAPVVTELFLIDAVQMYGKIYGSLTPLMHTFRAWFMVNRGRHVGALGDAEKFLPEGASLQDLIDLSRKEFQDEILPVYLAMDPDSGS